MAINCHPILFLFFHSLLQNFTQYWARNKYAHHILHIHHIFQVYIGGIYIYICAICKTLGINHVTNHTIHIWNLHFMLLAYITQQIWLPNANGGIPTFILYRYIDLTSVHVCAKTHLLQDLCQRLLQYTCQKQIYLKHNSGMPYISGHTWVM